MAGVLKLLIRITLSVAFASCMAFPSRAQLPGPLELTVAEIGAAFECAALAAVAGEQFILERERLLGLGIALLTDQHSSLAPTMLAWLQGNESSPVLESMGPQFWAGVLLMQFAVANAEMSSIEAERAFRRKNCVIVR